MIINEETLVMHLLNKNADALDFLIETYGGLIKSIIRKHLYQFESIHDECINDVILAVWQNIACFDEDRNTFKNWIAAIAKYKSIDYKRKYMKLWDLEKTMDETLQSELTADRAILDSELSEEIEELLGNLKKMDRELFIKYYIEEKDMDSIFKETGVESSVVYNRLSRGRRKLRDLVFARK